MQGGWITALILIIMTLMTNYTAKILIISLYTENSRIITYSKLGEYAFGVVGKFIVDIFIKASLVGVSSLFLILAGKFLNEAI